MIAVLIVVSVLFLVSFGFALMSLREYLMRCHNFRRFIAQSKHKAEWQWHGCQRGHMRRIRLLSCGNVPFRALIGFQLSPKHVDFYGYVESFNGSVVLETYVKGPKTFVFLAESNIELVAESDQDTQKETPRYIFPPHWWQRLGFFA